MAESFGDESVHEVLSQLHAETFALWMSFTEDQQQKDLTWHMQWEERSLLDMVHLINSPQCAQLAPATIGNLEPFLRRLAILVLLISAEQEAQTNAAS